MTTARIRHIETHLHSDLDDLAGARVQQRALQHLGLQTGEVTCGKVFSVALDLTRNQLSELASKALADELTTVTRIVGVDPPIDTAGIGSWLVVSKLPGVTDDEGISAQKAAADLLNLPLETATQCIFTHDLYLLRERVPVDDLTRLGRELLGNRLIHQFTAGHDTPRVYPVSEVRLEAAADFDEIDIFISDDDLLALSRTRVLSLSLEELHAIRHHYEDSQVRAARAGLGLPMLPTDCELEILAQTWSEHCKHKEFNALINYRDEDTGEERVIDSLFNTYIRRSTEIVRGRLQEYGTDWLVTVFNDNAGVVRIDDDRVFVWKVETHNTPSALDPYGGAITGILGNNRDPLGTGRGGARLLFNTNVLCFGPLDYDRDLLPGQLHPARVFSGVQKGIEDGGNKSGVPTVNGSILFDDRYAGKPLVYCGTGAIMASRYPQGDSWDKEIASGDCIVMAGGRVGKDGIHGATFSSTEIDKHSPLSAVQIGSPITQKLLSDFLEEACRTGLVKCATDNGAGGLSSSVGELATLSGGALVHLEAVPLKYPGLRPWEIFVSESQERMTLVVEPRYLTGLMAMAAHYEVEASDIGRFTDSGVLDVRFHGRPVAVLDVDFLHDGVPRKTMSATWRRPTTKEPDLPKVDDYGQLVLDLLGSNNICSREDVIRRYDHEVKGKTVVKPLMGATGVAPQDAAVMRFDFDSYQGIAISNGIAPKFGDIDPYHMSAGAFDEAVRQIISVGGILPDPSDRNNRFWTVNDNFCVPDSHYHPVHNPDGDMKLGKLVRMCEALFDMAVAYNIPMTSGKDSMKNDFKAGGERISVPPTVLYSIVARMDDVRMAVTSEFKAPGDLVYLAGETYDELGASELYRMLGFIGANVPRVRTEKALALYRLVGAANHQRLIESSHDLSDGGLAIAAAECAFGAGLGANLALPMDDLETRPWLFAESHSRFIMSVRPENQARFEQSMRGRYTRLGTVTQASDLRFSRGGEELVGLPLGELLEAWQNGLRLS